MKNSKYIILFLLVFEFIFSQRLPKISTEVHQNTISRKLTTKEQAETFLRLYGKGIHLNYEKEKIYVQTNHIFFKPGEELFYKIYVVNGQDNKAATLSKMVTVEIFDPSGKSVHREKKAIIAGYARGNYIFPEDGKGGVFRIRAYTKWMQNEIGKNFFEKEITVQKTIAPRILMKLDFPKKGISAGEQVIADFSIRNVTNSIVPFQKINYEVFVGGKEFLANSVYTNKDGKTQILFNLPKQLETTDVLLNVKTEIAGFKESISRNIPVALNAIELMFFPEGGSLANNVTSNVAFKAWNEFKQPIDIKGEILDEHYKKIGNIESYKFGMGKFPFTPAKGKKFYVKITQPNIPKLYDLPFGSDESVVLNIQKSNGKVEIYIMSQKRQNLKLIAKFREKTVVTRNIEADHFQKLEYSEPDFPMGITRFTLLDEANRPLAERVVFLNKDQQLKVVIKPNKKTYLPREKVVLDIETMDEKNIPISGNLSISVIDDKLYTYADDRQNTILSWLSLDSEIAGKVEEPSFYFKKEEAMAEGALDLVMLTNAYRFFELLPEIKEKGFLKFEYEKANSVFGKIVNQVGELEDATVFLLERSGTERALSQVTKEGYFYFYNLPSEGNYQLIAKPKNKKKKIKIEILAFQLANEVVLPSFSNPMSGKNLEEIDPQLKENSIMKILGQENSKGIKNEEKPMYRERNSLVSDTTKSSNLEEVVVAALGIKRTATLSYTTQSITPKEIPSTNLISALVGKVSGIQLSASNSNKISTTYNVTIRGSHSITSNDPLLVVDGYIVGKSDLQLNTNTISSVNVLRGGAATALYGSQGANGVIIISTIDRFPYDAKKMDLTPTNFAYLDIPNAYLGNESHYVRKFSHPIYETTKTSFRDDFRENIYWNPVIMTNQKGKATVEFYNSDATTTFRIISEGISSDGLLGRTEETYSSKGNFQLDAKLPQYLTMADQPQIPIVIHNKTNVPKDFELSFIASQDVKIKNKENLVQLKAMESKRVLLDLEVNKSTQSDLLIMISNNDERETQILPLLAEEKGFKHRFEYINNRDSLIHFRMKEQMKEATFAKLRIMRETTSKMLYDLDRLLIEPHGCFEQTSSTIYPNYFILNYVKSKGIVNSEIEKTALKRLKQGYALLINFETNDKGFSLFGDTPANVSLSAFALLEFSDLRKVIKVNDEMINRTLNFLLSQRLSNGTFKLSQNEYYPKENTEKYWAKQAYIVYALSKVGVINEITNQYNTILSHVNNTQDAYQLSLMANAAFARKNWKDYNAIMDVLLQKFNARSMKSETNFIDGSGKSLDVEVLALYASALMKNTETNPNLLARVINRLEQSTTTNPEHYTQAVVSILEALSEYYTKFHKEISVDIPKLTLNGVQIDEKTELSKILNNGENIILSKYEKGRGVPFVLEIHYYSQLPPENSESKLVLKTKLSVHKAKLSDNVRMNVIISNPEKRALGMVTAKIGIPAGLTMQPKLLKNMMETKQIAYYEIFDNYLVLYWYRLEENERIEVNLDLKAEFPGKYFGKANKVYEYYKPENLFWTDGEFIEIVD